jgi:diadenosine tetraphosphatase ApaH/serine/threonine PP2A family protein phosphatase
MNARTAKENFSAFDTQVCLIGHSHIPVIFVDGKLKHPDILLPSSGDMWRSEKRFLLNPGSVWQPRDRDPGLRMSFGTTKKKFGATTARRMTLNPSRNAFYSLEFHPGMPTAWRKAYRIPLRNISVLPASLT